MVPGTLTSSMANGKVHQFHFGLYMKLFQHAIPVTIHGLPGNTHLLGNSQCILARGDQQENLQFAVCELVKRRTLVPRANGVRPIPWPAGSR